VHDVGSRALRLCIHIKIDAGSHHAVIIIISQVIVQVVMMQQQILRVKNFSSELIIHKDNEILVFIMFSGIFKLTR
jgi:hypothetical protein